MLQVDDSKLSAGDGEFLSQWAEALKVSIPDLLGRILKGVVEGDYFHREDTDRLTPA